MQNIEKKEPENLSELQKEFVTYTLSLRLKALGFDKPCFGWYSKEEGNPLILGYCETYLGIENCVKAPTYSQAFRWFRKNHNLHVNKFGNENYTSFNLLEPKMVLLAYCDYNKTKNHYEESELACLLKLIEIVEKQQ